MSIPMEINKLNTTNKTIGGTTLDDLTVKAREFAPDVLKREVNGQIDRYDPTTQDLTTEEFHSDAMLNVDHGIYPPYPPVVQLPQSARQFHVDRVSLASGAIFTVRATFEPDYWKVYVIDGLPADGFSAYPSDSIIENAAAWCPNNKVLTLPGREFHITVKADVGNTAAVYVIAACSNVLFNVG